MQIKCPHCAELIQADANLCKHCKQPVGIAPAPVVVVRPAPNVVVETTTTTIE